MHLILNAGTQTIPAPQCSAVRFQHLEVPCRQRLSGEWHINPTGSSHCSRKGLVAANLRLSIEIDHVLQCLSVGFLRFWGTSRSQLTVAGGKSLTGRGAHRRCQEKFGRACRARSKTVAHLLCCLRIGGCFARSEVSASGRGSRAPIVTVSPICVTP